MLPRVQALEQMSQSNVLVHTSLKEATSNVVLEALERGLPVICHDACGMGTAVDERCGLKIPLRDPESSVRGFRDALIRVLDEPELLQRLSQGAFERAAELTWDKKVATYEHAYRQSVGSMRQRAAA